MTRERFVDAAGGLVWRRSEDDRKALEVLLIHRPKYDDWTLPKGKVEGGETLPETAVREIFEEADVRVRLGVPLGRIEYPLSGHTKRVTYWSARVVGHDDRRRFKGNDEADKRRWVRIEDAASQMTYKHDREVLDRFTDLRAAGLHRTRTLVVIRHAKAMDRGDFLGDDDLERPLVRSGQNRSRRVAPVLAAYGIRDVVSSPALRCMQTVEPYATAVGAPVAGDDRLSEQSSRDDAREVAASLLERKRPIVVCGHRPTLPWLFEALGVDPVALKPGDGVVLHHRHGEVRMVEELARPQ